MPFDILRGPVMYSYTLQNILIKSNNYYQMHKIVRLKVSLDYEFEAPRFVKVKAHKRTLGDKTVKVRSYYRRVLIRK